MADQTCKALIQQDEESYGGSFRSDLLEQYKLYVQSAENVSARRVASSRYLLSLNVALAALYGLQSASFGQSYWMLPIPFMGIFVSMLWFLIIKSHADLNRIKFSLIHEFEEHLPAAMYKREWELAAEEYRAVTKIERWIPILFATLHVVLAVMIVLAIVGVIDWAQ